MITIIDGNPGAGKTQFALQLLIKKSDKENRPVYYNGVPELNIDDWTEFDLGDQWHTLPDGAIILIDESQRIFPQRTAGSVKPDHVSALETHRHKGHDLFLVTQCGTLLDVQCRKLCGSYYHLKRAVGTGKVSITEYAEFARHNDYHERQKALGTRIWTHDKKIWKLYKSATIHTHKAKIPLKLFFLPLAFFAFSYAAYSAYDRWTGESPHLQQTKAAIDNPAGSKSEVTTGDLTPIQQRVIEKEQYFAQYVPRIKDQPDTAPVYDGLKTIQSYPRLQCLKSLNSGCSCYTQQATKVYISREACEKIINTGRTFDPSQPDNAMIVANMLKEDETPEWVNPEVGRIYETAEKKPQINIISHKARETAKPQFKYKTQSEPMKIEKVVRTGS